MNKDFTFREIPYNYTSFSDREIILKYFDEETLAILEKLRNQRVTGRSARLLFEVIGEIFIIERNPYIYDDYLENPKKLRRLQKLHTMRLGVIERGSRHDPLAVSIISKTRALSHEFFQGFQRERRFRDRVYRTLKTVTDRDNIHFSAFHKVAHSTDASDWRVEYPAVVVYAQSTDEVPGLVMAAKRLGLAIIPRGGGTGLTGGAVPVEKNTMIINTERLDRIGAIESITENGINIPIVHVEAGAITEDVIEHCRHAGFIFATDPTSAWASTIGGNISENAGGKKCVMWGTAIDNIHSFRIVDAQGQVLRIRRINHPHRKILPDDEIVFEVVRETPMGEIPLRTIRLGGTDVRKKGLGKDITNKALNGLPGIQKEGGDGIIIDASFVLYTPFACCTTVCLEFFGNNLINASRAIIEINNRFAGDPLVFLTALEHFDEQYVVAINYRNKSARTEIPKAVLLIDVESNDRALLDAAAREIIDLANKYNAAGAIAADQAQREHFWKDRKNLGAIARHTNAFKLNEDVVIPLERLPDFADFIEKINLEKTLANHVRCIGLIEELLKAQLSPEPDDSMRQRIDSFLETLGWKKYLYQKYLQNLDVPAYTVINDPALGRSRATVFTAIQNGELVIAFEQNIIEAFARIFHGYDELLERFSEITGNERRRKIIIATHMHAGDGNVHVNIPVFSNDYLMMREADETAGRIMKKTVALGGVISGEHGIGLTKLKFIDHSVLDEYAAYKKEHDPECLFNPGKLDAEFSASRIYTPSFNLLELEAFILKATDFERLSMSIASCVRCGKCKGVCNTHYPGGTMFYNPRNKIMGVGLIMEAVLYDAQASNAVFFRHFAKLQRIADHCTMCHNCKTPCPVKIDFGDVTLTMRGLMVHRKKSKFKGVTALTLFYLKRKGYYSNKLFRLGLLYWGYRAQRAGYLMHRPFALLTRRLMPRVNAFLAGRLPRSGQRSIRELLGLKGPNAFFAIENTALPVRQSVFYFPGCGSERMFPEISMAVLALLYHAGIRVVIPPEYRCCGYPFLANGRVDQADIKSNENRLILHKVADITGYMEIGHVIVSCGTCFEMLSRYEVQNIFNGARLMDINEFLAADGHYAGTAMAGEGLLYHDPCHTPLKHFGYQNTFKRLLGTVPQAIPNCCGEGGTLALSTPEISTMLRDRKTANIVAVAGAEKRATVLTTCPSCVQGLSKISGDIDITGKSLAVHAAEQFLGPHWKKEYLAQVKKRGVERILF